MKQIEISDETYFKLITVKEQLENKGKIDNFDELISEMIKIMWDFEGILERWEELSHLLKPLK